MLGYFLNGAYNHFMTFPVGKKKKKKNNNKDDDDDDAICKLLLEKKSAGRVRDGQRLTVPKGFLAVYVGDDMQRFVIPTSYLCTPTFRALMEKAAEEFGFEQTGGLRIPCDQDHFKEILTTLKAASRKYPN